MSRLITSRFLTGVLVLGALAAAGWVVLWVVGPVGSAVAFALLSLTPVAVLGALLVAVVALGTRRWAIGGVALVAALALAAVVLPRALADDDPPAAGVPTLAVATANLQFGEADPAALVALVRAERIDVLGLEELTPDAEARLGAAGLFDELPFRVDGGAHRARRHRPGLAPPPDAVGSHADARRVHPGHGPGGRPARAGGRRGGASRRTGVQRRSPGAGRGRSSGCPLRRPPESRRAC